MFAKNDNNNESYLRVANPCDNFDYWVGEVQNVDNVKMGFVVSP